MDNKETLDDFKTPLWCRKKIAPWFNQPGEIQYMLPDTVDELLDPNVGVLRRLQ